MGGLSPDRELLAIGGVEELVALQGAFGFELLPAHIAQVGLLSAVAVHVSFQVALAASGIFAQGAFEWLDACAKKENRNEERTVWR